MSAVSRPWEDLTQDEVERNIMSQVKTKYPGWCHGSTTENDVQGLTAVAKNLADAGATASRVVELLQPLEGIRPSHAVLAESRVMNAVIDLQWHSDPAVARLARMVNNQWREQMQRDAAVDRY